MPIRLLRASGEWSRVKQVDSAELCQAICYYFKKLELVFEFIEFKNYSQPKSIVPPKITLMNLLFESWIRW